MKEIKIGDISELHIDDMGHTGAGIGKIDGFTVFVEGAVVGDTVQVKIVELKKSYGFGKIIEFIEHSPHRVESECSVSDLCGGCQLQNIKYEEQLKLKKKMVVDNLERIGGISSISVNDVIGMETPFRYRNKAQFPVGQKNGKAVIGFYQKKSHEIVECESCILQHKINDKIVSDMKQIIDELGMTVYDEKTGKGLLRHIVTKVGWHTHEIMLILVTNKKAFPDKEIIIQEIIEKMPEVTTIIQNINTGKNPSVLGEKSITLYGKGYIIDSLKDVQFYISPLSFYQINPIQMEKLYSKALEYADLKGTETVFDLYSGIGTISLFLAKQSKKVIGVEMAPSAIKDAIKNAELNKITNTEFYHGKAEEVVPQLYKQGERADVVVVDPPRKGCDERLLKTMVEMKPERIVYISCNPSTLARDLKYLEENGYKTKEVQPVDMFGGTMHVESIILMTYCGSKKK